MYHPTNAVADIASRSSLSDGGKFYFYASQPDVQAANDFNKSCERQEANSSILGCFSNGKIYVYDVTDVQLDGIKEVTASHEMLHAVWQRMGASEQKSVGSLLEATYAKIKTPELTERMAYYDRSEPGEKDNELHSILGTEFASLSPELETHYAKYFTNRSQIVSLHTQYQSKFDTLKAQSDALKAQLDSMLVSLNAKSEKYNNDAKTLEADIAALKASADSVDRTSSTQVNQYNSKRAALIARINALDALRLDVNASSTAYNDKVTQYNKLIVSSNALTQSLDSTLAPAPSL